MSGPNPSGLCMCGCGRPTSVARHDNHRLGHVKGEHVRYISGHHGRRMGPDYIVTESGCWEWQKGRDAEGYGRIQRDKIKYKAHRVYYERDRGPIPEGMQLDHLCRNRACVNPEHLEAVSQAENCRRGANAKLKPSDVRVIRSRLALGDRQREIAAAFGVSPSTISLIKMQRKWVGVA